MSKNDSIEELVILLIAAFLLTTSEVFEMAAAIAAARLASMQAAYDRANGQVGLNSEWVASQDLIDQVNAQADLDAESIAETYRNDLEITTRSFLEGYLKSQGTLEGASAAAISMLNGQTAERATWKTEQIVNATCGAGANGGTIAWIDDFLNGLIDLPDGIDPNSMNIAVLPVESSSDFCHIYAGELYAIDDLDYLPKFPAHPNCIHRIEIVYLVL
jgi:hypothetical protein